MHFFKSRKSIFIRYKTYTMSLLQFPLGQSLTVFSCFSFYLDRFFFSFLPLRHSKKALKTSTFYDKPFFFSTSLLLDQSFQSDSGLFNFLSTILPLLSLFRLCQREQPLAVLAFVFFLTFLFLSVLFGFAP